LELQTGELVWAFTGVFGATIKGYGTGAGTVNKPLSIEVDYQGNLYYTQAGDFFPVHMIIPNLSGDFAVYSSGFQPDASDIMNASLYGSALDVAVDENKNVYVVDGADSDVIVFDANGKYFKEAGYESNSNIEESIMNQPVAVTVDKRGVVYVCDRGDGAVYRFKLSNSIDEDLKPDD
jgi:DNA-binding beta-propeller fold protein YncE